MNEVMLQAFHWFLKPDFPNNNNRNLWQFLRDEANHFREVGIDAVWLPPAYVSASARSNSVGYDVYDLFNLGEFPENSKTKYGNKDELIETISSLHGDGTNKRIQVYADVVINHKTGGASDNTYWQAIRVEKDNRNDERWGEGYERGEIEIETYSVFDYAERRGQYSSFKWNVRHFDSVDTAKSIKQNGNTFVDTPDKYIYRFLYNEDGYDPQEKSFEKWVSLEKGNYDYLTGCDLDYSRYDVREEIKYWGEWFVNTLDLDGVRLDAVKHINRDYIREWIGHIRWKAQKDLFAVGEYIQATTNTIHDYIKAISTEGSFPQKICVFDFPLRFKFKQASSEGVSYDLRMLNTVTIMAEQPALSVTFVENHDYEFGRSFDSHVEEWFKPLAYAFILLREGGFPCVFFPDYYGSLDWFQHTGQKAGRTYLDILLKLRKQFALGEEKYYAERNVAGWVRMGFVPNAKGAMAVAISNSFQSVSAIKMNTGRSNKHFYHFATIKWTEEGFLVVTNSYERYGDKANGLLTDYDGFAYFPVEGGSVSIWLEGGTVVV